MMIGIYIRVFANSANSMPVMTMTRVILALLVVPSKVGISATLSQGQITKVDRTEDNVQKKKPDNNGVKSCIISAHGIREI